MAALWNYTSLYKPVLCATPLKSLTTLNYSLIKTNFQKQRELGRSYVVNLEPKNINYVFFFIYHAPPADNRAVRYKLKSCTVPIFVPFRLSNVPAFVVPSRRV